MDDNKTTNPLGGSEPAGAAPQAPQAATQASPTSPTPQPAAFMNPANPSSPAPSKVRNKKKMLTIALVAVLVLVLGGGGTLFALNKAKANKPENAVAYAAARTFDSKQMQAVSKISFKSTETGGYSGDFGMELVGDKDKQAYELKLSIGNIKSGEMDLSKVKVGFDVRIIKEDAYFKIENLTDSINAVYDEFVKAAGPEMEAQYGPLKEDIIKLAEKITDKWVKIPAETAKQSGYDCLLNDAQSELSKKDKDAIAKAYKQNTFMELKKKHASEDINGVKSEHFTMGINQAKANSFAKSFDSLEITKKLDECTKELSTTTGTDAVTEDPISSNDISMDVWIGGSAKKITKLSIPLDDKESKTAGSFDTTFKYEGIPNVETPTDAMSWEEFIAMAQQAYAESSFGQAYGGTLTENSTKLGTGLIQDFSSTLSESL